MALSVASNIERRAGEMVLEQARRAGMEAAAARLRAIRRRAALAGSIGHAISCWPPSVTALISSTWWNPYLRPRTWAPVRSLERQARREEGRRQRRTGKQPAQGAFAGVMEKAPDQAALEAEAMAQAELQAQAEARERAEQKAKAKEWHRQQWLQSNVRAAMYYGLRHGPVEDVAPIVRSIGLSPMEEYNPSRRPRVAPQGRFFAGLPDALQEIFPQMPPELAAIAEGAKKPAEDAELVGGKPRKPTTAQVTRIRSGPTSALAFTGLLHPPQVVGLGGRGAQRRPPTSSGDGVGPGARPLPATALPLP